MSTHFIHNMKHGHHIRRLFFKRLIKSGEAVVVDRLKNGFIVKSVNGIDCRISRKGMVVINEQSH